MNQGEMMHAAEALPELQAENERMRRALAAVLLWHKGGGWGHEERARWDALTGREETTSRALCDVVRAALGEAPPPAGEAPAQLFTVEILGPNDFTIRHNGTVLDGLGWDEALGAVAEIMHPRIGRSRYDRSPPFASVAPGP